jgi:hypothetical protein
VEFYVVFEQQRAGDEFACRDDYRAPACLVGLVYGLLYGLGIDRFAISYSAQILDINSLAKHFA